MFTVPVMIFALSGALCVGVGTAFGGLALVVSLAFAAILLSLAWVLYRHAASETSPAPLPGGALPGVATVVSYRAIGATIHDEPMIEATLRISIPGRTPYEVKLCDVVGLYESSRLTTSASFRCAVDPGHPHDITVRWDQVVPLEGVSDPQNRLGVHTPVRTDASLSAADLLANGMPGTARVVQCSSQGTVAPNGDPILVFILHVVPDNGTPPFQSLTAQRVPPERLAKTAVGAVLRVCYDPENRTRMVAIDWETAPEAAAPPTPVMPAADEQARRVRTPRTGRHAANKAAGPPVAASTHGGSA